MNAIIDKIKRGCVRLEFPTHPKVIHNSKENRDLEVTFSFLFFAVFVNRSHLDFVHYGFCGLFGTRKAEAVKREAKEYDDSGDDEVFHN